MDKLLKYLIYLGIASLIFGPLGVIPLNIPMVNLYLTDIFIFLICLIMLCKVKALIKIIKTDKVSFYFMIFSTICLISLIISPISLSLSERLISGLYLIRLIIYFGIYLAVRYLLKSKTISARNIVKGLITVGIILVFLGWGQYLLYPNLRNLYYLGWDPHLKRIFASFLDPNYFGLILVLILLVLFFVPKANVIMWILRFVTLLTLMFTYSRSSYLALFAAVLFYAILTRKYAIFGATLVLVFLLAALLPRPEGIGVRLERVFSFVERVGNWREGIALFSRHPIIGVGFNTIRYAKRQFGISEADLMISHAGAGFDNSFLVVAVTTGIIGLASFMLFIRQALLEANLLAKISLLAVITHSLFLNSLFFPWIMLWMWILLAVS